MTTPFACAMVMADEASRCLCARGSRLVTKEPLAHATQASSSRGVLAEGILLALIRRPGIALMMGVGSEPVYFDFILLAKVVYCAR